jgi:hypothetical protein
MNRKMIAAAGLVLALVGCSPVASARASTPPVTVATRPPGNLVRSSAATFATAGTWVYGDSITVQTWQNLHPYGGLAVDAKWGRTAGATVDQLMSDLRTVPRIPRTVVVAAGTNDFLTHADLTYAVARARHQSQALHYRLIWVNVYVDTRPDAWELNHIITAGGPDVHVMDWAGMLTAHLDPAGTSPALRDGIHVNETGAVWRNNLLMRAVQGIVGGTVN